MQISIIIPTYNRVEDLNKCLDSIRFQTILPKEIVIVDDSDNNEIQDLLEHIKIEFKEKSIFLKYIRNKKEKSLAIARNTGIEYTAGDIILFLDDDVILDKDYIKQILKVYEKHPDALGVQGYITNIDFNRFWNTVHKIDLSGHFERNKCRVQTSTDATYPYLLNDVILCQWLSGANHSYKRNIFQNFRYDENLKKYSYKEDVDMSYRIFKVHPNSLFITPHAKLIHNLSKEGRIPNKMLLNMKQVYTLYFFYKNIDQNIINKMIFIWSWIMPLIINAFISIVRFIKTGSKNGLITVIYTIGAYIICIKNIRYIKKGDLKFLNQANI